MQDLVKVHKKGIKIAALVAFATIEAAIYVVIHTADSRYFPPFAYASVVLAFAFSFLSLAYGAQRIGWFVRAGFLFTLGADLCLVVLIPTRELAGVCLFIPAQLLYGAYVACTIGKGRVNTAHVITRAVASLLGIVLPLIVLGSGADLLSVVSVFYYAQLVVNLVFSFFSRKLRIFSLGLVLFALCDLSIGLSELARGYLGADPGSILYTITHTGVNLAWVFYLPSQVLISASLLTVGGKNGKENI